MARCLVAMGGGRSEGGVVSCKLWVLSNIHVVDTSIDFPLAFSQYGGS